MRELKTNLPVFLFLGSVSTLLAWRCLAGTFVLSLRDAEYTHILLILPISASLIFLERKSMHAQADFDLRLSPFLMLSAGAIAVWVLSGSASLAADMQLSLGMLALVLAWIGIFVLSFGRRASRTVLFPLLFLFGLVPFPRTVLNFIVAMLQQGSAWSAHVLFAASGVPVFQQGVVLTIPGLTVEVAQECSSIRSTSMLVVTTLVLAQILLRSPWRKALTAGLAIPLSVAKNGFRIFTLAMLGTRVDPGYLTGRLHHQGGPAFFALALAGVFALIWVLRRGERASLAKDLKPLPVTSLRD